MPEIVSRKTQEIFIEAVYKEKLLRALYPSKGFAPSLFFRVVRYLISNVLYFSNLIGVWNRLSRSKKEVQPFVEQYGLDQSEWKKKISEFTSFNDFFIRELKEEVRPIDPQSKFVCPADGRYQIISNISSKGTWEIKGKDYSLEQLLDSPSEAYHGGSLVLIRLCPLDYHRFHSPCKGKISQITSIPGPLYSVHPWSIKYHLERMIENKRLIIEIEDRETPPTQMVIIGATGVGQITLNVEPGQTLAKGEEMGYFEFGGSAIALVLPPQKLKFSKDWVELLQKFPGFEIYSEMGSSLASQ